MEMTDGKKNTKCIAVILAGGSGSRMGSSVPKQYMTLSGRPLIWYALNAMQKSDIIDECILVTGADDTEKVREEIVEKYGFDKVINIVAGGSERCFSVANAMKHIDGCENSYVFIHDGARPFINETILKDTYEAAVKYRACVAAVPVKDTIKIADKDGFVTSTPDRNLLWSIQTPQVFESVLIKKAYSLLTNEKYDELRSIGIAVTDDAGVVELFTDVKVKLVTASYENIKITTPGDFILAENILSKFNA
jgi:2-C-methyl-D-erythritol 4-phosphate cytidylyltransferase